jgi:RNA polymerase sigma-70 factor, ECF subfamily
MTMDRSKPDEDRCDGPKPGATDRREDLESTAALLAAVKAGHDGARDRLVARYLPVLLRWAHGRLPRSARDLSETEDLVHVGLLKALAHVGTFEHQHEGAFLAYLRQILRNEIRMEIRRTSRRPIRQPLHEDLAVRAPSPLEQAVGNDALRAYEAGLARLQEEEREAVILRLEFGLKHDQVAAALGKPSADAARMLVARALVRLTAAMDI